MRFEIMKITFTLILVLFTNTFVHSQSLDSLYNQYNIQLTNGDIKRAEKTMLSIAEQEAQIFFSLIDTAKTFYESENWEEYVKYLNKSINYYSDHPSPSTMEFHGKKDSLYYLSIECLNNVFDINREVVTLNIRAVMKMELEEYKWAIEDYSLIIKYDSTNHTTYYNRAMAYSMIGMNQEALYDYSKSIKLNPKYASAVLNRGFLYMDMEDYSKAIIDFENSIELNQIEFEKAYALNNIGYCLYKLGKLDDSQNYIENSINLYPINSFAYRNLALVHIALKNKELACENILKSIELGFVSSYGTEILELQKINCE
jgi:tetratricopeptide (TPR) repeat protein